MKQKVYNLKIHSKSRFIISLILIINLLSILALNYLPETDNEVLFFLKFVLILLIAFYCAYQIALGVVKLTFTSEGIEHIWTRRYLFSNQNGVKISWNLVESYIFDNDTSFDTFKINLVNNTRYKLSRINFIKIKDDFEKLKRDFPKLANEFQTGKLINDYIKIEEGPSQYDSPVFRWTIYGLVAILLFLFLAKLNNPNEGTSWATLCILGSSLLFFVMMITNRSKKL